jgi:pimeloyl-ACP methyl ester carboxylesterase
MHNDNTARFRLTHCLPDGRLIGYAEHGDPDGEPLFVFHGLPGSRLQRHPDERIAKSARARLITVDRPGFGLSDPQPGRRLTDWPRDIAQLADALGLEKFRVAGVSGGAPYAAACAHAMPDRVLVAGLVSGLVPRAWLKGMPDRAPFLRALYMLASLRGIALIPPLALFAWLARHRPRVCLNGLCRGLNETDCDVLWRSEVRAMLAKDLRAAFRQGAHGLREDLLLLAGPWGFAPEDIRVPVLLWHGEDDHLVPAGCGRMLAARIPDCQARFLPGGGHFVALDYWPDILAALLAGHLL